jgi:hypothetical protein
VARRERLVLRLFVLSGIALPLEEWSVLGTHLHGVDDQQAVLDLNSHDLSSITPFGSGPRNTIRSSSSAESSGAASRMIVSAVLTTCPLLARLMRCLRADLAHRICIVSDKIVSV